MTPLLGLTAREALNRHFGKRLVFRIIGGNEGETEEAEMRVIRVINFDDKIECTLADPIHPQGKTPSK